MSSQRPLRIAFIVTGDGGAARPATTISRRDSPDTTWPSGGQGSPLVPRRETRDGVEYVLAPSAPGNRLIDPAINPGNLFWRLVQKIERADVYHLFQPNENSALLWLALQKLRANEGALFAWDWDDLWCGGLLTPETVPNMPRWRYRLIDRFEHTLPRRAELVTTCSDYLARLGPQPRHGGCGDPQRLGPAMPPDRASLRARLGLRSEAFYLGFIGWTPTEVTWCLDALARLDGNVRLASCGYDIRQNLGAYPGLTDRVDYLGKLPPDDARQLMNAIDVGLLPLADSHFNRSRLPIKFADYLAAGVPAICGDVGEVGALGRRIRGAILARRRRQVGSWLRAAVREIQQNPTGIFPTRGAEEPTLAASGRSEAPIGRVKHLNQRTARIDVFSGVTARATRSW